MVQPGPPMRELNIAWFTRQFASVRHLPCLSHHAMQKAPHCFRRCPLLFVWCLVVKAVFHAIPSIFRFTAHLFTLPNRRFYAPAMDYEHVANEKGLHPIPSVIDLHSPVMTQTFASLRQEPWPQAAQWQCLRWCQNTWPGIVANEGRHQGFGGNAGTVVPDRDGGRKYTKMRMVSTPLSIMAQFHHGYHHGYWQC